MPSGISTAVDNLTPYMADGFLPTHTGKGHRSRAIKPEDRPFVAWDGEGENLDGANLPQSYTLFGSSASEPLLARSHLGTFELLEYITDVGKRNPTAFHIGFAFNYDVNMIVRSLAESAIRRLHETGKLTLQRRNDKYRYHIQYIPSKSFTVTRYDADYDKKLNPRAKTTVKIFDIFTFFGTSFIKAYEDLVGAVPTVVSEGKANRNEFASLSPEYVEIYWRAEIDMLRQLAEELRSRMYGANLRIREWHGPGALASYANRTHAIKPAMAISPDAVREAARYAYAGGRFEMFKLGRTNGPIYSLDINSAYPHAIRQLPNLATGTWRRVECPTTIVKFGVYHVRLLPQHGDSFLEWKPGPLFHRDKMGNISFPWILDGWYWSPEVRNLLEFVDPKRYEIVEGWEYAEWNVTSQTSITSSVNPLPYSWLTDTYALRKQWKRQGNASQLALKLMMNSLYGKMAQRVGWNEAKRTAPNWHQLEWAGWVTSYCRAMLWAAMQRIPFAGLLAVETDGLYTTVPPDVILGSEYGERVGDAGIRSGDYSSSEDLGGWEVKTYDEILYVQSGLAWLRKRDKWECKRRGLDAKTFTLDDCRTYLGKLKAGERWEAYEGRTTRFIGMGAALNSAAPFKVKHCVWQTVEREIRPGQGGKRIHVWKQCRACLNGLSALDMGHDMSIRSLAYFDPVSHPHDIPWENGDLGYLHRENEDIGEVVV